MRRFAVALLSLVAVACGAAPTASSPSSQAVDTTPAGSGTATASETAAPAPSPSSVPSLTGGPFGILYSAGNLELVKPDASIAASVPMQWSGLDCSASHDAVNLQPPVSATDHQVYFRDGGKIRLVVAPNDAQDVTTVPNSATVVSFFSVSPDDRRIAVVVVDVTSATVLSTRLYVEDLRGGTHHADIYSTSASKTGNPTTLWPMGWHGGNLVLAVVHACTFEPVGLSPLEWHVSSAATAARVATIKSTNSCVLSTWPTAGGVACVQPGGATTLYDLSGKTLGVTGPGTSFDGQDSSLSPHGHSVFFSTGVGIGVTTPATRLVQLGPGPYATLSGYAACLWIDEDHLLAPNAVISFASETPGNVQVTAGVTALPQSGVCAGRFPGGL
jgi:hypothetical protein